jgi:hypothetical protein
VVEEVFRNWDHPYDALPPDDLDEKAQSEWIVKLFLDRDAETTRAVQFSLCDTVCQCVIEVERVYVEFAGYVFDAVGA